MKDRFKELRKHLGLSQNQMAKEIHKTPGFISSIETGKSRMSAETLEELSEAFGVNLQWLQEGIGEMFLEGRDTPKAELKHIGERIYCIRAKEGLTQEEFGSRINRSKNQVYLVEAGKSSPSERFLWAVCDEFRISRQWLISGQGDMKDKAKDSEDVMDRIVDFLCEDSVAREVVLEAMDRDRTIWLKFDRLMHEEDQVKRTSAWNGN